MIRIKSWKGRPVADMTRDQLIEALTESAQKNIALASRLKEPPPSVDFFDNVVSGASRIAGFFRKK
jgi:hypothetical protein